MAIDLADQISQKTSGFIQSENHRDLLDIVDCLCSSGVNHYVDLPRIIVCGSQSSGKSAALEAHSGIAFPTAEGLCTRFGCVLALAVYSLWLCTRFASELSRSNLPHRTEAERIKPLKFSETKTDQKNSSKIIENAKAQMGLGSGADSKVFSTDVLRIESISPTAPNLTLVDLPGLFAAADNNQTNDGADLVQILVIGYMKHRRSIILAVISADNPFANQPVTQYRQFDPSGSRTLSLITKPDRIDRGSDSEKYYGMVSAL
ncbi:P-loop containing nucleoside triphosphate hydrolase protein [Rhexocercosporidium sp. MPI-PUGE-AT-0058]|nr:P-loop containing nucleoside triphosphate hydrolase protein [Rhexocercosporidium sp. MPI-PUGE-AT-0058]